jgi:hypothetical protein
MTMNGNDVGLPEDPPIREVPMVWAAGRGRGKSGPFVQLRVAHSMGVTEYLLTCDLAKQVGNMLIKHATGIEVPGDRL